MRRLVALLVLLMTAPAVGGPRPPKALAWAYEAMDTDAQPPADAPLWILWNEATVAPLDNSGKIRFQVRELIRVLSAQGQREALQPIFYSKSRRLVSFRAWTIRPDGSYEEFDRKRAVDHSLSTYHEYSDSRVMVLPLRNVGVGSTIALEYVLDREDFALQDLWPFQWSFPVAVSRFVLKLPRGWAYDAKFLNMEPLTPRQEGASTVWELRDVAGLAGNYSSAPLGNQAAKLAITYLPPSKSRGAESFRDWTGVASWYERLVEPQAKSDESIREAVAGLVGQTADPMERIRSIGGYVQSLRYVSVSLGLSAYRPHASPDVFRNRYGDCKDKATLMKTMLREAGIESYPVLVYTRTEGKVFPEFPSPRQFNHVILAIPVQGATGMAATARHPSLGTLLLFDPTDEATPVGDLPWTDQGTRGLLVHSEHGGLLDLPALPAAVNRAEREWDLQIEVNGFATLQLRATYSGQYARMIRARYSGRDDAARLERLLTAHGSGVPGARLLEASFHDLDAADLPVRIEARLEVEKFGRRAGPMRLTKPLAFLESLSPVLPEESGGRAFLLPFHFTETDRMRIRIPEGWTVQELPGDSSEESSLGRFTLQWRRGEEALELERKLEVEALEVPLDGYATGRSFFSQVAGASNVSLVIERS